MKAAMFSNEEWAKMIADGTLKNPIEALEVKPFSDIPIKIRMDMIKFYKSHPVDNRPYEVAVKEEEFKLASYKMRN